MDGKASGEGRYVWRHSEDEDIYEGEWRERKLHGRGFLTWADGARHEGEVAGGNRHGHGTWFWADGRHEEGEYRNGCWLFDGFLLPRMAFNSNTVTASLYPTDKAPTGKIPMAVDAGVPCRQGQPVHGAFPLRAGKPRLWMASRDTEFPHRTRAARGSESHVRQDLRPVSFGAGQ